MIEKMMLSENGAVKSAMLYNLLKRLRWLAQWASTRTFNRDTWKADYKKKIMPEHKLGKNCHNQEAHNKDFEH